MRVMLGCAAIGSTMVVGLLAACGGGSGGGGAAAAVPSGAAAGGAAAAFQAYADCLRQHGVNIAVPSGRPSGFRPSGFRPSGFRPSGVLPSGVLPSGVRPSGRGGFPGFGGGPPLGVDQSTWDAAQQACAGLRPSFGAAGGATALSRRTATV